MADENVDQGAQESTENPGAESASEQGSEFGELFSFSGESDQPTDSGAEQQSSQEQGEGSGEQTPPDGSGDQTSSQEKPEDGQQPEGTQEQQPAEGESEQQTSQTPSEGKAPGEEGEKQEPAAPQYTAEQVQEMRSNFVNEQAKQLGELMTDDFVQELENDPKTAFPKMAAEVIAKTHDMLLPAMQKMIQEQTPQVVQSVQTQEQQQKEGEDRFFKAFPELNDPKLKEVIHRVGKPYRDANPKASAEQFIKDVGTQAWIAAGLDMQTLQQRLDALAGGGSQQSQQPAQTGQQQSGGGQQKPFTPAAPGGSSSASSGERSPDNEFVELVEEEMLQDQ